MTRPPVAAPLPDLRDGACSTPAAIAIFDEITTTTAPQAVAICHTCPAKTRAACLDYAVRHMDSGVWGGMGKNGLRNERANRGIKLQTLREGEIADRVKTSSKVRRA